MLIYWIALIITIFFSFIFANENIKIGKNRKISYFRVFLSFLPLFLLALFRWNVGVDVVYQTGYYYKAYYAIGNSLGNIFNYEPGFYYLMKTFSDLNLNIYIMYVFITIVFFFCFTKFIYKNVKNIAFGAIIFFLSNLYLFSFSTLRQSLGIALALYPISKIINNEFNYKNILLWISIILSISMHESILYLFIIVFLSKIKISKRKLVISTFIILILSPFFQNIIIKIIQNFSYFNKYAGTNMFVSDFSITYFSISLVLFIISLINYKRILKMNKNNYILINICAFTTILMANSKFLIMPYRIFPLFVPLYLVLCSRILESMNKKTYIYLFTYIYIVIPFFLLFINQYYILGAKEYYKYKTIFNYHNQVWITRKGA